MVAADPANEVGSPVLAADYLPVADPHLRQPGRRPSTDVAGRPGNREPTTLNFLPDHAVRLLGLAKSTAIPHGSRTRKLPPSRSSTSIPAARVRELTAARSAGSSSTTVQWRRPALPAGAGGTPSPRHMLKARW